MLVGDFLDQLIDALEKRIVQRLAGRLQIANPCEGLFSWCVGFERLGVDRLKQVPGPDRIAPDALCRIQKLFAVGGIKPVPGGVRHVATSPPVESQAICNRK